ncbi:ewing's tumor-associated antigen 1 [Amphiprion ocellaris]|uniref:ewing's tumor-associated antigen 1 n=1 Tax=Amphiprion ocellaris TaxID=80972 RepID=UPI00241191AD|nr:ewing's tumor-associated antigen 1 [Amphiprion ocellaris]
MNGGRRSFDPPAGTARPRASRLSRSLRQTQAEAEVESLQRQQSDFKTPTRVLRSRPAAESPQNDGNLQQDIFWDATSPHGKRGRKQIAGVVDISEIVSRIAPKHGRPTVAEPTLQQWIGDSATIPCTPDLHPPKPKKKSPRPNAVEHLLKLARQFDFSLFHQDEDEEENQNQQLLSENLRVFDSSKSSASLPGSCRSTESAATRTDVQLHLDQNLEDDLDLLFNGTTQHVSRNLSQASHGGAAPTSSSGPTEFEDDWEHDDLLDDSLLLEMTQNPQNFTTPKHCSTQKPDQGTPAAAGATSRPPGATAGNENLRPRTTFKLESHPGFSGRGIPTDNRTKQQNSAAAGGDSRSAQLEPQNPQLHQKVSAAASSTSQRKPDVYHSKTSAASEDLDLDLDSLFSLEPVWDDPADDDLLCEMCEHLENQIHGLDNMLSNQRAALQWTRRTWDDPIQPPQKHSAGPTGPAGVLLAAAGPAGISLAARGAAGVSLAARGTAGVSLAAAGPAGVSLAAAGPAGVSLAAAGPAGVSLAAGHMPVSSLTKEHFMFKRPSNSVSMMTANKAKCSAAEIELKKQQAMERRRQRLQAQNRREPT